MQWYSVRGRTSLKSFLVPRWPGMWVMKLGQPVPLSYFMREVKSGRPQPAQTKTPGRFSRSSGLENARSVPSSRSTSNCAGLRIFFHSASDRSSGSVESVTSAPGASSAFQSRRIASTSCSLAVAAGRAELLSQPTPAIASGVTTTAPRKVRRFMMGLASLDRPKR